MAYSTAAAIKCVMLQSMIVALARWKALRIAIRNAAPTRQFFTQSFIYKHVIIHGHTDRQREARETGQCKRGLDRDHNRQQDHDIQHQHDIGDQAGENGNTRA